MRVGYIHDWKSNWFNEKHFAEYLAEDVRIREHITNKLAHAGLSSITIRKDSQELEVNIHTARPGIVIGKSGSEVDALRRDLHKMTNKQIKVNILEIKRPELDASLVAQSIAEQLQNRVAFRRAMKRALTSAMRSGAKGVKVQVAGRLGGAEMARTESYSDGRVPLHTMRADIDYGFYESRTTFGRIGVKCWINKGEIMPEGYTGADLTDITAPAPSSNDRDGRGGRDGRDGRGRGRGGGPGGGGRGRLVGVLGRGLLDDLWGVLLWSLSRGSLRRLGGLRRVLGGLGRLVLLLVSHVFRFVSAVGCQLLSPRSSCSRATVRARARSRLARPMPAVLSSSPVALEKRRPNTSLRSTAIRLDRSPGSMSRISLAFISASVLTQHELGLHR
jgi:small subunit ribosomal protein S3